MYCRKRAYIPYKAKPSLLEKWPDGGSLPISDQTQFQESY